MCRVFVGRGGRSGSDWCAEVQYPPPGVKGDDPGFSPLSVQEECAILWTLDAP